MGGMRDSESFGVEAGRGEEVVGWMNEQARRRGYKFEARLYGHELRTENFGSFEMFSWVGDAGSARSLTTRASKRFKARVIEGGYKPAERVIRVKRSEYGMVKRGGKVIGHVEFEAARFGRQKWSVKAEERR